MRRSPALAGFAAALACGFIALFALAATDRSALVYTIGVDPAGAAPVRAGKEGCKGPRAPPADAFERVVLVIGTYFRPGPPLQVTIRDARGRALAAGRVTGGYPDIGRMPQHRVP